ncbi:MAG: hypothetical protein WDA00_07095 [Eubacteriales bacterium]
MLTLKETALVLEGLTIDRKALKDHLEAVGHRDALHYMMEIASREIPLVGKCYQAYSFTRSDEPSRGAGPVPPGERETIRHFSGQFKSKKRRRG